MKASKKFYVRTVKKCCCAKELKVKCWAFHCNVWNYDKNLSSEDFQVFFVILGSYQQGG